MNLFRIAWRSIQQRAVSSGLTVLSMGLGVALMVAVLVINGAIDESFRRSADGYEMIVGAKGGRLQLVLNTVYHLSTPVGNMPYSYYKEFIKLPDPAQPGRYSWVGKYANYVELAIPYCLGDNYRGFRVVGTTPELFEAFEYAPGKHYAFAEGDNFTADGVFEGVIGSLVAVKTGLRVGDTFAPTHGVTSEDGHAHDPFTVVGILAPTGTPNDRALFVNMEGFFLLEGHALEEDKPRAKPAAAAAPAGSTGPGPAATATATGTAPPANTAAAATPPATGTVPPPAAPDRPALLPESRREVTAVLLRTNPNDPHALMLSTSLQKVINREPYAQLVYPRREISVLFDSLIGNVRLLLLLLTAMVVIVAGIGIMVSIYNSMSERRREIAIMRSLGARRTTVLAVVLVESVLLSLAGAVLGLALGHGLVGALGPWVVRETGVEIGLAYLPEAGLFLPDAVFERLALRNSGLAETLKQFPIELLLVPGCMLLAAIVGFLPAVAAYRTDVAKALSNAP